MIIVLLNLKKEHLPIAPNKKGVQIVLLFNNLIL